MNAASYNRFNSSQVPSKATQNLKATLFVKLYPGVFLSFMFFSLNSKSCFFPKRKNPLQRREDSLHSDTASIQSLPHNKSPCCKQTVISNPRSPRRQKNTENQRSPSKLMQGLVNWNREIEEQVGQDTVFSMLGRSQTTAPVFKTCCNSESRPGRSYISNRNN